MIDRAELANLVRGVAHMLAQGHIPIDAVSILGRAAAALSAGEGGAEEIGWLIEAGWSKGSKPDYWMGCYDPWMALERETSFSCAQWPYALWTNDHLRAVRFARKEDAERVAASLHEAVKPRVCDHSWSMAIVRDANPKPRKDGEAMFSDKMDLPKSPEELDALIREIAPNASGASRADVPAGASEEGLREITNKIVERNPLICGPCGAALPNPECGHKLNGVSPCCIPQTDDLAEDIYQALRRLSPTADLSTEETLRRVLVDVLNEHGNLKTAEIVKNGYQPQSVPLRAIYSAMSRVARPTAAPADLLKAAKEAHASLTFYRGLYDSTISIENRIALLMQRIQLGLDDEVAIRVLFLAIRSAEGGEG